MKLSAEFARIVFWLAVASCVVAQLGILWSTWRGLAVRETESDSSAGETSGSRQRVRRAPELFWAILPAVALVLVFAGTWRAMQYSDAGITPIHRHPPATVSKAPTLLASYSTPRRRAHAVPHGTESEVPQLMGDLPRSEAIEVPEVPQR